MCGFVGYLGNVEPAAAEQLLRRMTGSIAHREPDEQGVFVCPSAGLGHARLSVVGLGDGQQPMASASGDLHIAFNGEIFNYVELRDELKARGRRFRTGSDTEVILHLYEEMGPDCVDLMNGDFAFAIWDAPRQRMFFARDRMGVRPLFYTEVRGTLYFASEVKAFARVPGFTAELDEIALDQIFTLWAPIAPGTAFKNVYELEPGHIMIADKGGLVTRPYWQLDFPDAEASRAPRDERQAAEELRELLTDATRIRMRADVTVGSYLSGGLDSSIVSVLAAPMATGGLRTFSVTFDSAEHDESEFQEEMALAIGAHHSAVNVGPGDIASIFPEVIKSTERPGIRTAPAPLYQLSGLFRAKGIKVVLTGEGADEVFAGYDIFKETLVRRFCDRQPGSASRPHLFRKLYPYLPGLQKQSASYLAAFFGAGKDSLDDPLYSHRPRMRNTAAAKLFFSGDLRAKLSSYDAAAELASQLPERFARWHPLHQAQYLESRFPFLDHRLVEFASKLSPGMKLKGLVEKHILREATKDLLPPSIGNRTKQPYRAPDSKSFVGAGEQPWLRDAISSEAIADPGFFDVSTVRKLTEKCRQQAVSGFRDNAAFVGILSTQLWNRSFAGSRSDVTEAA